jgi:primosomal protein N' (replication factor Y)
VADQIRAVEGVVEQRFFAPPYWMLLQRVADHYQVPLMQVLKTALPPGILAKIAAAAAVTRAIALPQRPRSARLMNCVDDLQRSATGDYTWPYLQSAATATAAATAHSAGLGRVVPAPPQPPRAKQRQA